jgi:hypothetical protein
MTARAPPLALNAFVRPKTASLSKEVPSMACPEPEFLTSMHGELDEQPVRLSWLAIGDELAGSMADAPIASAAHAATSAVPTENLTRM